MTDGAGIYEFVEWEKKMSGASSFLRPPLKAGWLAGMTNLPIFALQRHQFLFLRNDIIHRG